MQFAMNHVCHIEQTMSHIATHCIIMQLDLHYVCRIDARIDARIVRDLHFVPSCNSCHNCKHILF